MAGVEFRITDNSAETLASFEQNMKAALEACGNQAASHAKQNVAEASRIKTGAMRNSINHRVSGKNAYVGTNISYAKFHEMGTGIYIAGGRKSPWAYQDGDGNWHWTRGIPPIHFIKRSVEEHIAEYREIFIRFLRRTK